jgi:PAS domain S-box-containing protein
MEQSDYMPNQSQSKYAEKNIRIPSAMQPRGEDTNAGAVARRCVLFVEDNADDFEIIEHYLSIYKEAGLVLEHADCLAVALDRLRSDGIDIIILDLSLPDSQGIETLKKVRRSAPAIPIIVLSGLADINIAMESLTCGAEDYLIKGSVDTLSLGRSINYALARHIARETYERLATIVEASSDAIIGKTLNGTITSWNNGAAKLFGYSAEEAKGKSISMLFPPELSKELAGILATIADGESVRNLETVRLNKNGDRIDILATISPILTADGTVGSAAAIDRDITERKQSQKVLQESEERYRLLVAGVKDYAIFMIDANGLVESWNEGAKQVKGYSAAEIIGQHFSVFYTPEDRELSLPETCLKTAMAEGSFEEEGWRLRQDGSRFFANVIITPLFSAAGELRGFTNISRDITVRMLSEKEIADARLRLSLALDAAAIGVWDFDILKNSVWRSLRHDEIFGHHDPLPEWNFDIFATYIVPEDRAATKKAFKLGIAQGQFRMQCRIIRADDKAIRWISLRGETFRDEEGTVVRMIGTVADITDINEKLEQKRLFSIMKEREDFMATLTHDMKNPLIGANRLLEMFVSGRLGEITFQQCDMLQCLKESNSELLRLIADLIDVYRFEKDVKILSPSDCDLVSIISLCSSRIVAFAELRSIKFITELPQKMEVVADARRIERVVQNLLDNALKFTPDNGTMKVRLFSQEANIVIEIEDNGPGITPEEQPRLFQRFAQGSAGKRYAGGSGLGLYLCKQIVDAHGGTISCESQPNKVTIFRVILPKTNDPNETVVGP